MLELVGFVSLGEAAATRDSAETAKHKLRTFMVAMRGGPRSCCLPVCWRTGEEIVSTFSGLGATYIVVHHPFSRPQSPLSRAAPGLRICQPITKLTSNRIVLPD